MADALIARLERFVSLSDAEREAVAEAFLKRRSVKGGTQIVREKNEADGIVTIIDGMAGQYRVRADGKRQIVGYFLPGDFVHFGALASDETLFGVSTFTHSIVSVIETPDFLALVSSTPTLSRGFWHLTIEQLSIAREWIVQLGLASAEQKLAQFFCEQHYRMEEIGRADGGTISLPVTQRDLGDITGLTSVHVNRTLQEMRANGLIAFEGGALTILDSQRLRRIALFDSGYLEWRKGKWAPPIPA